jgi:hypothetical protein
MSLPLSEDNDSDNFKALRKHFLLPTRDIVTGNRVAVPGSSYCYCYRNGTLSQETDLLCRQKILTNVALGPIFSLACSVQILVRSFLKQLVFNIYYLFEVRTAGLVSDKGHKIK